RFAEHAPLSDSYCKLARYKRCLLLFQVAINSCVGLCQGNWPSTAGALMSHPLPQPMLTLGGSRNGCQNWLWCKSVPWTVRLPVSAPSDYVRRLLDDNARAS